MMEVLGSDYVRTAKAKGLSEARSCLQTRPQKLAFPGHHLAGLQFSAVISGAVLVEAVFSWPGLGTLAFQSIIARDTPNNSWHPFLLSARCDHWQPLNRS